MAVDDKGRFSSWPEWLLQYRRPDVASVEDMRSQPCPDCGKLEHECPCIDAMIESVSK